MHVKSTKGPIDVYLCEVEQQKPGAKTFEGMDTVTCKTEPSVPPDEGSVLHLHFFPRVIFLFFFFLRLSYHFDKLFSTSI